MYTTDKWFSDTGLTALLKKILFHTKENGEYLFRSPENLIQFHPVDNKILDNRNSHYVIEQDAVRYSQFYHRRLHIKYIIKTLIKIILHYTKN